MVAFKSKEDAREDVWQRMTNERVALFPFPIKGRIPNFKGAKRAAKNLFEVEPWKTAKYLKINPDSPMRPLRLMALERGVTYFMPTPRLAGGFMKFDPSKIPHNYRAEATALSSCEKWAEFVPLEELPKMDGIVAGSVAVTATGFRCGKGKGYSDLEYSILLELGHNHVPVATLVHDTQLVELFPRESNDLPLSVIATPSKVIHVANPPPPPSGIDWSKLSETELREMPVLLELKHKIELGGT